MFREPKLSQEEWNRKFLNLKQEPEERGIAFFHPVRTAGEEAFNNSPVEFQQEKIRTGFINGLLDDLTRRELKTSRMTINEILQKVQDDEDAIIEDNRAKAVEKVATNNSNNSNNLNDSNDSNQSTSSRNSSFNQDSRSQSAYNMAKQVSFSNERFDCNFCKSNGHYERQCGSKIRFNEQNQQSSKHKLTV
jgi:hypothetical protein